MVLNIAHRGARSLAPENTLAAARKALKIGADLWETDLAVTKDEELILTHDDSLARTTDVEIRFAGRAPGPFTEYTLEEIRSLDAGSWFERIDPSGQIAAGNVTPSELKSYRGEKIPTLEEALLFTQKNEWRLNLELKRLPAPLSDFPVVKRVLALVDKLKIAPTNLLFSSIRHDWLKAIQAARPEFAVEALMGILPSDPMDWSGYAFKTYNVRCTRTSEKEVRDLTGKGHALNLYVLNEKTEMKRWIAAGAAGLITDFPQRARRLPQRRREDGEPR